MSKHGVSLVSASDARRISSRNGMGLVVSSGRASIWLGLLRGYPCHNRSILIKRFMISTAGPLQKMMALMG